jgi:hypothetical protein
VPERIGEQLTLFIVASVAPDTYPGCDLDEDGINHRCKKTAPNSVSKLGAASGNLPIELCPNTTKPNPVVELGLVVSKSLALEKLGSENINLGSKDFLDPKFISAPCPAGDSIDCATIDPKWHGSIERKHINKRPYYYWRHYQGKIRRSTYLSGNWVKALTKLAKCQLSATSTDNLPK